MVARLPMVLFADRDLSWSRPVREELRRRGADVRTAGTVDEALAHASKRRADLLILDDDLEGQGDRDVVEVFRTAMPDAEIILLESGSEGTLRGAGRGLFFSGAKPIAPEMLLSLAESALEGRLPQQPVDGVTRSQGTVVCVDDDPAYLASLTRFLSRHGYRVVAFDSAERALDSVLRVKPDLALVDLMMPGMGGLELADGIRAVTRGETPVVMLTALDSEETNYQGHQHGALYMVGKSELPQKVLDVVDYYAGHLEESERELIKNRL